ncbi:hypothetical protein F2Q69_00015110 [Brassica cretica]|uniref:Uncharacterized protein n=1 Tax=Brassica cretica TaxID=69181 RepID=A0A8S9R4C5_BRACR|nr:hypothetical protein F2Q69_00015110 [Brassica cretica]
MRYHGKLVILELVEHGMFKKLPWNMFCDAASVLLSAASSWADEEVNHLPTVRVL